MINYGFISRGALLIEHVGIKPNWSISQHGRLLFEKSTNNYWIGGETDWILVNIFSKSFELSNLDLNHTMDDLNIDQISSLKIPIKYNSEVTNIQNTFIQDNTIISTIITGEGLDNNSIIDRHVGFNATDISLINVLNHFPVNSTIEDSLNFLFSKRSDYYLVEDSFANHIPELDGDNIQLVLQNIELYLSSLSAENIKSDDITVQESIDSLFSEYSSLTFLNLSNMPFFRDNKYLKSVKGNIQFDDVWLTNLKFTGKNGQELLYDIYDSLNYVFKIPIGHTHPSTDIKYIDIMTGENSNLDNILEYLLTHLKFREDDFKAINFTTLNSNIQFDLEELQSRLYQILNFLPEEELTPDNFIFVYGDRRLTLCDALDFLYDARLNNAACNPISHKFRYYSKSQFDQKYNLDKLLETLRTGGTGGTGDIGPSGNPGKMLTGSCR